MAPQAADARDRFVSSLLTHGADVHLPHPQTGGTALHAAADTGAMASVKCLLAANALVDARDARHYTPLVEASREGHHQIVGSLIEAGASLDLQQRTGMTALMAAVYGSSAPTVERLMRARARTDIVDESGVTAARMAGNMRRLELVQLIVKRRCSHCGRLGAGETKLGAGETKLQACARCGKASYCGRSCQKAAWKVHKLECVPCEADALVRGAADK